MKRFEDLQGNVQALILAKLALELNTHHCLTISGLAKKRRTDVTTAWRDICRSSGQPACTIPYEVVHLH